MVHSLKKKSLNKSGFFYFFLENEDERKRIDDQ